MCCIKLVLIYHGWMLDQRMLEKLTRIKVIYAKMLLCHAHPYAPPDPPMHFHFPDSILSTIILLPTLFLPCSHIRDKCVNISARWSFPALPRIMKARKCQHALRQSVLSRAANNTTGTGPAGKTLMD